jgi:hypothetical protein
MKQVGTSFLTTYLYYLKAKGKGLGMSELHLIETKLLKS